MQEEHGHSEGVSLVKDHSNSDGVSLSKDHGNSEGFVLVKNHGNSDSNTDGVSLMSLKDGKIWREYQFWTRDDILMVCMYVCMCVCVCIYE